VVVPGVVSVSPVSVVSAVVSAACSSSSTAQTSTAPSMAMVRTAVTTMNRPRPFGPGKSGR
jgi:hypothetical protein